MPDQVKVEDFEVFRLFRGAMLKFAQAAAQALSNADSQIARTHSWLETEQAAYWQSQLRKRQEAVVRAREAVRQKKVYKDFSGNVRSAPEEEKALARCQAAVQEAEHKIEMVRKSLPRLEKAAAMYRGGVSRLGKTLMDDIPRAVALLDRLAATLEQYVQIEAPAGVSSETAAATPFEESMARGGDGGADGAASPAASAPGSAPAPGAGSSGAAPAGAPATPAPKEG